MQRLETEYAHFLIAEPWKAIADEIYSHHRKWPTIHALSSDLRIELDTIQTSDLNSLQHIAQNYPSQYVKKNLQQFIKELC